MSSSTTATNSATKKAKLTTTTEDEGHIEKLQSDAVEAFHTRFPEHKTYTIGYAPGRVNLIGEHTDYSQGFVFPIAIALGTVCVAARSSSSKKVRVFSLQMPNRGVEEFAPGEMTTGDKAWCIFLSGVSAKHPLTFGVDLVINSNVPLGGGLSSSAALEVAFAIVLEHLSDPERKWDGVARALRCVEGDHEYAKIPCGIMDQFISSNAVEGSALLIDCMDNSFEVVPVALKESGLALIIVNTNVSHSHSTGEYKTRVKQCQAACQALGVNSLRMITDYELLSAIQDPIVKKRAKHVVGENQRCISAASRAKRRDWSMFGELMFASHESLRDDFEVSCDELDFLVESAMARFPEQVLGARMTGGGFGGSMIVLAKVEHVAELSAMLSSQYLEKFATNATVTVVNEPMGGARIIA